MEDNYMSDEREIDLREIARKIWAARGLILKTCIIAVAIGLVIGFSIPKEYTSHASLAPEFSSRSSLSNLSSYASMMGINLSSSTATRDAVYPDLYPDIIYSTPFITGLFNLPVTFTHKDEPVETSLYDYLLNYSRYPWWSAVISAPFRLAGWAAGLFKDKQDGEDREEDMSNIIVDEFKLTKAQERVYKKLASRIAVKVDKKTYVVSIAATMQDPEISALVAEASVGNLQEYITNYRTEKARNDLEYSIRLFEDAKADYEKARNIYARYADSHQGIVSMSARIEQEKLQNEANLAYQLYNQTAQKLQLAQAKVQEETPVFKILQPPTVPLHKSKPSKMKILFVMVVLALCGASAWALWGDAIKDSFKSAE